MRILFLDDMKERWWEFNDIVSKLRARGDLKEVVAADWAMSAQMAITLMEERHYDLIFLDHDLEQSHYGGNMDDPTTEDGRKVARWMAENLRTGGDRPFIHIHSWNYSGAKEMAAILRDAGHSTSVAMFPKGIEDVLAAVEAFKG
jgi:CheY-like chemotaxis protein